jgi:hypothetical protein
MSLFLRAQLWLDKKRFGSLGPSVVRVSKVRIIKGPCESVDIVARRKQVYIGWLEATVLLLSTYQKRRRRLYVHSTYLAA